MMMMFAKLLKSNVSFSSHHPHFSFTFIQYHMKRYGIFSYMMP